MQKHKQVNAGDKTQSVENNNPTPKQTPLAADIDENVKREDEYNDVVKKMTGSTDNEDKKVD